MRHINCAIAATAFALSIGGAVSGSALADDTYKGVSDGGGYLTLGGGVIIKPKYEGSKEHEVYGFPMIIPRFSGEGNSQFSKFRKRVKFKGLDDIRIKAVGNDRFEFGAVTGYRGGRDQDDARRLNGLGDVDGGLVLGGYAGVHVGSVLFDVSTASQVTGDDTGTTVRLGAETKHQISPRMKLRARVGTTLADDDYMQSFFGVTPAQAATSGAGLAAFNPDGGFKDVHAELSTDTDIGEKWVLRLGIRYARLVGDAADSPVIETEDQVTGTIGLGFKFGGGR